MKTSILAIAALASIVLAQDLPNIPQCALACFANALTTDGCSGLADFECHCQKPELIPSVTPCVNAACSTEDQANVISVVQDTCASAGHPISIPAATSDTPVSLPSPSEDSSAAVTSAEPTETNMENFPSITDTAISVSDNPSPTETPSRTSDASMPAPSSSDSSGVAAASTAVGGLAAVVFAGAAVLL